MAAAPCRPSLVVTLLLQVSAHSVLLQASLESRCPSRDSMLLQAGMRSKTAQFDHRRKAQSAKSARISKDSILLQASTQVKRKSAKAALSKASTESLFLQASMESGCAPAPVAWTLARPAALAQEAASGKFSKDSSLLQASIERKRAQAEMPKAKDAHTKAGAVVSTPTTDSILLQAGLERARTDRTDRSRQKARKQHAAYDQAVSESVLLQAGVETKRARAKLHKAATEKLTKEHS